MTKGKLSLVFGLFLFLYGSITLRAQSTTTSSVGIALSEYCVSNIGLTAVPQTDYYGNPSDWVELISNFSASVSLSGYYLSNDRLNLFKWKFPSNAVLGPGQFKIVWLSGKNTIAPNGEYHANFNIDQCKNQWLILTNSQGVVRDSVYVRRTKESHSRGRVDYSLIGKDGWRVFTTSSFSLANTANYYVDYATKPIIKPISDSSSAFTGTNAGGFYTDVLAAQPQLMLYLENGVYYDTLNTCFRIYYTLDNGDYPVPGAPGTTKWDGFPITVSSPATLIRAISVPFSSGNPAAPSGCEQQYLSSFCETNTYFNDPNYETFTPEFGVVSIAMDRGDTSWFNSSGAAKPIVHVEYYDNKKQVCEGYTQINRPVNEEWATKQRGFYMTIDDRRGFGCNFEGNIFNVDGLGSSTRKEFPTLHLKAGDYESHSQSSGGAPSAGTAIMDVFYQSLAAKNNLRVSPLHIKPVIAFVNGKYQGVFDLREVYDKYYENYYYHQPADSLDMMYFHNNADGAITYFDGPPSNISSGSSLVSGNSFVNTVYTLGISPTINSVINYDKLFQRLDKESFMDYMILNSYAMNSNLWKYNIAFARGSNAGSKWHYYLWNTPAIFNFTAISLPGAAYYPDVDISPCVIHSSLTPVTPPAGNGHGNILRNLMGTPSSVGSGRGLFQLEYKNRYQDLLNGPLKCENILKHYDYVVALFTKEMEFMQDPSTVPVASPYPQGQPGEWDTNVVVIRRGIVKRCARMSDAFGTFVNCYGMRGPYPLTVDVQPPGAGKVKLNSLLLDSYIWSGSYFATTLAFKAIPTDDSYSFHHWEFKNHVPLNGVPLSVDSVAIGFAQPGDDVVAVFTDKKNDISMPTGFTPNGDGINDFFQAQGSALFAKDFDMSVWNRWGQEVYRTTDPTQGWDGYFKGQQAQTGVYAYVISYKNFYNESKILKGNLTLLR